MTDVIETLSNAITTQDAAIRASIPQDRIAALIGLVRAQDRVLERRDPTRVPAFDPVHGCRVANPGGNLAFSLALRRADPDADGCEGEITPDNWLIATDTDGWAERFLAACGDLSDARQVLAHLTTGFMRGEIGDDGRVNVWIAQKRFPPAWRERIDVAWWEAHSHRIATDSPTQDLDWQFGFLPDALVAGIPARTWAGAVRLLRDQLAHVATPISEADLGNHLAEGLGVAPDAATSILAAMTLDDENAAWHATVPGIASAPLIRLSPTTLIPSQFGLQTQPLLFLARELRRRDAQGWHNVAHQREAAVRHELAAIFADKRYVHAPTRIQLKRDGGTLRTDIDAAIFDRKTGTLTTFELKSQDPFSRSQDELDRRRYNVLAANRQLSGILDWITRHKPDEILDRIDHQTAKRFKVQRVLPFVLARTLVHFNDGPAPDKRAAWGTWPDVLRLHDDGILAPTTANPLQALFTRLQGWPGDPTPPPETPLRTLCLGDLTVTVSSSRPG